MTNLQLHKQVPAKVSAYVDEGIKNLAELLNTFSRISTFESCEGRKVKLAHVYMNYGECDKQYDDGKEFEGMAHFVNKLAISFARHTKEQIFSGGYLVNISIEWWGNKRFPFVSIEMPYNHIDEVTDILTRFRSEFDNNRKDTQLSHVLG